MSKISTRIRRNIAQATVWAQVEHPVGTATIIRKVTSAASSKKSKQPATTSGTQRQHGLAAADVAAGVPTTQTDRVDGIVAANIAARIPGFH